MKNTENMKIMQEALQETKEMIEKEAVTDVTAETAEPEKESNRPEPGKAEEKPEPKKQEQKKTGTAKEGKKMEKMKKENGKAEAVKTGPSPAVVAKMKREFTKRAGIIEKNLANIENSFLAIAFQLHWIKANKMYKEAGFKNIYDYAESTHGIGRTSCSNLVCIVENFAERDENGNVIEKIAVCYRKFKQSQLVAMMGLSPEQIARIDENTSVRKINQMKRDTEIIQEEDDGENDGGQDSGTEEGQEGSRPEPVKKFVNTLIQFNNYERYQKDLEEIDALVERAFKKSTLPVIIKIICEQG